MHLKTMNQTTGDKRHPAIEYEFDSSKLQPPGSKKLDRGPESWIGPTIGALKCLLSEGCHLRQLQSWPKRLEDSI
jgi:hypothetical protein